MNKTTENRLGGELRSQQTAQRLLEELRTGLYARAAQLPSELELTEVLGVSRTVVRDALSELERDGYLERVRGIGTLVNRDVLKVENRMDQKLEFNRMIRSIGRVPHSDNLMVTRETAMPELAANTAAGSGSTPQTHHSAPHTTPTSGKAQSEYRMFFLFQSNCGTGTAENMANATAIVCKTVMGVFLLCSTPAGRTPRGRRRRLWRQRHC